MNRDLIRKWRLTMRVVPAVVSSIVIIIVLIAMLMPNGIVSVSETEPISISVKGSEMFMDGRYEIESDLPYPVENLSLKVILTDRGNSSEIILWEKDGITLDPGSNSSLDVHSRFFLPAVVLFAKGLMSNTDASADVIISVSGNYMMGLIDVRVDGHVRSPLTQPGSEIDCSIEKDGLSHMIFTISGLADHLLPDDSNTVLESDDSMIGIDIGTNENRLRIEITSDRDLKESIASLRMAEQLTMTDISGNSTIVTPGDIDIELSILSAVAGLS